MVGRLLEDNLKYYYLISSPFCQVSEASYSYLGINTPKIQQDMAQTIL